jgi:hypothetical protein
MLDLLLPLLLAAAAAQPPAISPAGGAYSGAQTITVKPMTGGSTIRCTTDGTDPVLASARPTTPIPVITLLTSATVRCRAWAPRRRPSAIAEQTYTISDGFAVSPSVLAVAPGEVVTFTTVPFQAGATWTATAGSITAGGVYTAPSCAAKDTDVVVKATVNSAPATAGLRIQDKVTAVTIAPTTATVSQGGTVQFSATVKTVCFPTGISQPAIFKAPPQTFGGPTSFAAAIRPTPKKRGKP